MDLIIVGAGPAGVSAAIEATARGLSVAVLDENATPGGRIWQALETREAKDAEDAAALATLHAFRRCPADIRFHASVWSIEADGTVFFTADGASHAMRGKRILLATGTIERALPVPGWTLPGVMTVGAAQIVLKTSGLVPDQNTWIAGQGPLVLLYTVQALRAGGRVGGVLDISDPKQRWPALRHIPAALREMRDLMQGLSWHREIARARIPWLHASDLRAEGDGIVQRITFRTAQGQRTVPANLLLLHDGVIPSVQITRALGCEHRWNRMQHCWEPVTGPWGTTSVPGIFVAGDGASVGGARTAALSGRIAALGVAHDLGRIDAAARDKAAAHLKAQRSRSLASRPLLDTLFAHRPLVLDNATIVCRCEEVTAGQIRQAAAQGCLGLNQLKAYTRCGMGPCQGRMCASTAADVMAGKRGVPVAQIEPFRTRFPTKPLTVGELAALR